MRPSTSSTKHIYEVGANAPSSEVKRGAEQAAQSRESGEHLQQINHNIETIAALRARAEQGVSRHQHAIEALTAFLGRPRVFYWALGTVAMWVLCNLGAPWLHLTPPDPPPFVWLQGAVGSGALLISMIVLITQNRQGRLAEQHAHLDLQINMLAEQKTTKVIALLEELRRDMPTVPNRHDPEVEALQKPADPSAMISALEETLEEGAIEQAERLEEQLIDELHQSASLPILLLW